MNNQIIRVIDVVPIEIVKKQFDAINAKGVTQLKEVRGPGVDLNTWSKYPCVKENECNEESYCDNTHISITVVPIPVGINWKLIPPNLTILAKREGKRTYIINDNVLRDFVEAKIFVIHRWEVEHIKIRLL
jgi:hypothetical protein